jgi:hypothetical protein
VQSVTDAVLALPGGTRFTVAFPLRLSAKVTHAVVVENLRAQGSCASPSTARCCTSTTSGRAGST